MKFKKLISNFTSKESKKPKYFLMISLYKKFANFAFKKRKKFQFTSIISPNKFLSSKNTPSFSTFHSANKFLYSYSNHKPSPIYKFAFKNQFNKYSNKKPSNCLPLIIKNSMKKSSKKKNNFT